MPTATSSARQTPAGLTTTGTVFELKNTWSAPVYTPTTLVSFNGANGAYPYGGLIADANGDLFGTTSWAGRPAMARCSSS